MCQQQVFWVQQWCVNIEVVTEMWCGLCKGSWQSQRETRTFISASSVCLFCHLLSYSTLCTWRLWVKIKAAVNVLTCISVKTINFSNYLCVLHTSESQHSTVVRACGELPACLSMEMRSAFLFCPVIYIFHVSAVTFFAFDFRYSREPICLCFQRHFLLLQLWPQILSDYLEWKGCMLNVEVVKCEFCPISYLSLRVWSFPFSGKTV